MFQMKATHVQKFFSLGGLLKCPYPLLSAIETKINVQYHVSFQFREEYSLIFSSSSDISQPRKILQLLRGNDWVGLSPSRAFAFLGALGWEKLQNFSDFDHTIGLHKPDILFHRLEWDRSF